MEEKFIEIKAENTDIAVVRTSISNEEIDKFFSLNTAILDFNFYKL